MNTMNRRHCAGLIVPCRVQLLSLNQPCAAISGVRRAKRLQPAISFRLSAAIKHPSSICDRSGGHTSAQRACAGTVSGNSAAWQAPGAMSAVQSTPTKTPTVILSHAAVGSVVQMFAASALHAHQNTCHTVMTSFVTLYLCNRYYYFITILTMHRLLSTALFSFIQEFQYFLTNNTFQSSLFQDFNY